MTEDADGNIWAATENGLCKYNEQTKKWKRYYNIPVIVTNQRIDLVISQSVFYGEMREIILLPIVPVQPATICSNPKRSFFIKAQASGVAMANILKEYK